MIKFTVTEKEVKSRILDFVKQNFNQYRLKKDQDIRQKTFLYLGWSALGLVLLIFQAPKTVFYPLAGLMLIFILYSFFNFIKILIKTYRFINQFDNNLREMVKKKIKTIEDQSLKNKVGLWLSGQNNTDIENFCISYFVRELAKHFKNYQFPLAVRILTCFIAFSILKTIFLKVVSALL